MFILWSHPGSRSSKVFHIITSDHPAKFMGHGASLVASEADCFKRDLGEVLNTENFCFESFLFVLFYKYIDRCIGKWGR